MAGIIVVDRIESDASYASSINVASPMVVSNTLTMASSSRVSGDIIVGTTRSANTSARIEVSGTNVDAGLLVRQTSNTSYAGMRFYNATDTAFRALEIDYSSPGYSGSLVSGGPTGESGSITTTGAYPLTLGTNNTARLIVDSSGRITTPNQPAFRVKPDATYNNIAQGAGVPFKTIEFDKNNNYNTTTSRFTAPVAGVYFFTAAVYVMTNVTVQASLSMNKNGSFFAVGELHNISGNLGYGMLTVACCTELAVNDYVDLSMRVGQGHLNSGFNNYFSGFLVG